MIVESASKVLPMFVTRRFALLGAAGLLLSACVGASFKTDYDPLPASTSGSWRLADVRVTVPRSLSVSEAKTLLPDADIVWREDPMGDRHAQVAAIIDAAVTRGAQGLRGKRPVRIDVTVTRFHALTFEAETRGQNWGVHNVDFIAQVTDAATGEVLVPPSPIRAELPALAGQEMRQARQRGITQKSMITDHVARTVAGWLGIGPDNRGEFNRQGN
ncbi:DUF6778 family protein [Tabrizicola sp.]|uniref:DUF6778 family protein n=1 Tax=Tabrizicola sp. TaxID=2005166 RepID=UPI0035B1AB39